MYYGTKSLLSIQLVLEQNPKTGVQNPIVTEDTTPLPGRVSVAVFRESRAVCGAVGSWKSPVAAFVSLRNSRAELNQGSAVLGQGYQCCGRAPRAPRALCGHSLARAAFSGYHKENKLLQKSQ